MIMSSEEMISEEMSNSEEMNNETHGIGKIPGAICEANYKKATLRGHTDCVYCLTLHENKLYSGSDENIIRIRNTETYEEIATLRGHTDAVMCLTLHENKLYSGSEDETICIWNT